MANSLKGQKYHCSIISESEWNSYTQMERDRVNPHDIKTLCGLGVTGRSWDFPAEFSQNQNGYSGLPKCKKCLKSPKYPLLILGEL